MTDITQGPDEANQSRHRRKLKYIQQRAKRKKDQETRQEKIDIYREAHEKGQTDPAKRKDDEWNSQRDQFEDDMDRY